MKIEKSSVKAGVAIINAKFVPSDRPLPIPNGSWQS